MATDGLTRLERGKMAKKRSLCSVFTQCLTLSNDLLHTHFTVQRSTVPSGPVRCCQNWREHRSKSSRRTRQLRRAPFGKLKLLLPLSEDFGRRNKHQMLNFSFFEEHLTTKTHNSNIDKEKTNYNLSLDHRLQH